MNDIEQRLHELLDTPDPLARWLAGKADDDVVGIARHACHCPLGEFVAHSLGVDRSRILVLPSGMNVCGHVIRPWWTETFTRSIDALMPWSQTWTDTVPITAATARDILSGIGGAS